MYNAMRITPLQSFCAANEKEAFRRTGFPLVIAFIAAVVLMIVAISKYKVHPFLSIMGVFLLLALAAGIPLTGIAGVIGIFLVFLIF